MVQACTVAAKRPRLLTSTSRHTRCMGREGLGSTVSAGETTVGDVMVGRVVMTGVAGVIGSTAGVEGWERGVNCWES